jgi:multicomponent Na+:H+ antiporter subunit G
VKETISATLVLLGGAVMLLAAVGIVRMPDLFTRMSAAAKSSTLGVALMLASIALYFADLAIATRALATCLFIIVTAPVAAHVIGRAAYFSGVPLWRDTVVDQLKGRYDMKTHRVLSDEEEFPIKGED